jgi:CheY-like chemotaxis protein
MLLPRSRVEPQETPGDRHIPAGPALRYDQLVLLVDDDDEVREVTAGILEDAGYAVVTATDGPAALEVMDREGDAVALVVADYVMPGMTGRELWTAIRGRRPTLPFLLATGYADHLALTGDGLSIEQIVRKPFRSAELFARIQTVLAQQATLAA